MSVSPRREEGEDEWQTFSGGAGDSTDSNSHIQQQGLKQSSKAPTAPSLKPVSEMTPEEIAAEARKILLSSPRGLRSTVGRSNNASTGPINTTTTTTTTTTKKKNDTDTLHSSSISRLQNSSTLSGDTTAMLVSPISGERGGLVRHDNNNNNQSHNADDNAMYDYSNYSTEGFSKHKNSTNNDDDEEGKKRAIPTFSTSAAGAYYSSSYPPADAPLSYNYGGDQRSGGDVALLSPRSALRRRDSSNHSMSDSDSAVQPRSARRVIVTEEKQYAPEAVELVDLPLSLSLLYQAAYAVQVKQPCENLKKLLLDIAVVNGAARVAAEAEAERIRRDACLRLYTQSTQRQSKLDEIRSTVKKQLLDEEDKECTFRPTISKHGQELRRNYHTPSGKVDFAAMSLSSLEWLKSREKKLKAKAAKAEENEAEALKEALLPMSEKSKKLAEKYRAKQEEKKALEAALNELQRSASPHTMMNRNSASPMRAQSSMMPYNPSHRRSVSACNNNNNNNTTINVINDSSNSTMMMSPPPRRGNNNNAGDDGPQMVTVRRVKKLIRKKKQAEEHGDTKNEEKDGDDAKSPSLSPSTGAAPPPVLRDGPTREASPASEDGGASSSTKEKVSAGEVAYVDGDRDLADDEEYYFEEVEEEVPADEVGGDDYYPNNEENKSNMLMQYSESVARFLNASGQVDPKLLEKIHNYRRSVLDDAANRDYYPPFVPVTNSGAFDHYFSTSPASTRGRSGEARRLTSGGESPTSASTPGRGDREGGGGEDGQTTANARIVQRLLDDVEQRKLRQEQRLKEAEERRKEKLFDPLTGQPFFKPNAAPTVVVGKKRIPVTELPPKEREEALKILKTKKLDFLLSVAKKKENDGSPQRDLTAFLKYCQEMQTQATRRMEKIRKIEEKELEGLFVPAVNKKSEKIVKGKNMEPPHKRELPKKEAPPPPPPKRESDGEAIKNMMERSKQWEERREQLKNRKIREINKEEFAECTFNPKLRKRVAGELTAAAEQRLAGELAMLRAQEELLKIEEEKRRQQQREASMRQGSRSSAASIDRAASVRSAAHQQQLLSADPYYAQQPYGSQGMTNYNTAPLHYTVPSSGSMRRERNNTTHDNNKATAIRSNMYADPTHNLGEGGVVGPHHAALPMEIPHSNMPTHRSEHASSSAGAFGEHVISEAGSFNRSQHQHYNNNNASNPYRPSQQREDGLATALFTSDGYPLPPAGSAARERSSIGESVAVAAATQKPTTTTTTSVDDLIESWKELDALTDAILSSGI